MIEKVGNLEVLISKEAPSNYYGFNNVMVRLLSLNRPIRNYEMKSADTINPRHSVKFENIPLGHYKVEVSCKGYLCKNDIVYVQFPGSDTHWKGHFRRSRNRKFITIKKESGDTISEKGINLLKSIEKLRTKPYDDQTGKEITNWVEGATIGYGHLIAKTEWGKYKNGITEPQAFVLFKSDLSPFEKKVKYLVKVPLLQNQFDALVILAFNIGESSFSSSSILKLVNNPSAKTPYSNIEKAWMAWDKSRGKIMKGLENRRKAEWNIYSKNIYQGW
jgi:GH24 family phage-related lysozyme (muramidase)